LNGESFAQKQKLRDHWKTSFPKNPDVRRELSTKICRWISVSEEFRKARVIAIYHPRESEVDPLSLWHLRPEVCVFPKVFPKKKELIFFSVRALTDLTSGFGGIKEPPTAVDRQIRTWTNNDLILVPGYVFDKGGGRIASGLGYYDRFLAQLPSGVQKWGVCFGEQISKEPLVQNTTDVRMDAVCSEQGIGYVEK